jgi:hypothetical protein
LLTDKIDEMLEACVQMVFKPKGHDMLKVRVVDVCINSEESFEDDFDNRKEGFWEWDTFGMSMADWKCYRFNREKVFHCLVGFPPKS